MIILGDKIRITAGHMVGTPTAAEARFWVFDEAHFSGAAAEDFRRWISAVESSADKAREEMQLSASAAPGAQTGIDVLLAEGMAREL